MHSDKVYMFLNFTIFMKLVILMRTDIKMGKGKMIAQAIHAAVGATSKRNWKYLKWRLTGEKVVVLKADIETINKKIKQCKKQGIRTYEVIDAGRTQVKPGTKTCVAIGPDDDEKVDKICSDLKLL